MKWKLLASAAALGALTLMVSTACGDDDDSGTETKEVRVQMTDQLRFEPSEIRTKAGEPILLVIDNSKGSTLHDFTIDDMPVMDVHAGMGGAEHAMGDDEMMAAVHMAMEGGHKGDLEFTPTEPGRYEFYCTVSGHAQAGMKGTLIVE